ncbi:MAG TPA: hypothetical protein VFB96_09975 [Pirellulaceae bacterium]|nr:hypothetical protein [Pirellulaceae bacterium]
MAAELRPKYRPSGRFDVLRLAVAIPLNLLVATALGSLMAIIAIWYTYIIVIVPVVLTVPLAVAGYYSAKWSQLRNPVIAAGMGIVLGAMMYVGQYGTKYAILAGNGGAQLEEMPRFIAESVQGQMVYDSEKRELLYTTPLENWAIFAMEIGLCMLGTGFGWYIASARPFCERCSRFMRKKAITLDRGCAEALALALGQGSLDSLVDSPPSHDPCGCRVELVGCTHGGHDDSVECFITAITNACSLELSALTVAEYNAVATKYPQLRM